MTLKLRKLISKQEGETFRVVGSEARGTVQTKRPLGEIPEPAVVAIARSVDCRLAFRKDLGLAEESSGEVAFVIDKNTGEYLVQIETF